MKKLVYTMAMIFTASVQLNGANVQAAPPPNDNLANATTVPPAGGIIMGTNVDATKEPAEPDHAGVPGGASIWYSWTAPSSGLVAFSTQGSAIDTVLAVYTGANYPLTLIAENDDEDFGGGIVTSRVAFAASAGTTYKIAIDGFEAETGSVQLSTEVGVMPPANDNLANATVIAGASGSVSGTNVDASKESGELNIAGNPGGASVWWQWTAPASGLVFVDTNGSTFDTILGVFTGSSHPLTLVVDNDDGSMGTSSEVMFMAVSGTTYRIGVDGYDGATGSIMLAWIMPPPEVTAINRMNASPTNASSVQFGVTFNKTVTGVDATDFTVTASGVTGASVAGVSGSGSSYTVTVNTGTGDGTIRLDLIDNDSIVDSGSTPLGGVGAGNGNFTSGQLYTIDKTAPVVASITAVSGTVVDLIFTEAGALGSSVLVGANYTVTGAGKGTVSANPSTVALQSGKTYRLTWGSGSMINGQPITVTVANVQDAAGNAIGAQNSASNLALPVTLSAFSIE